MISVSCLDSKFLNNNNWYGRFQLVSFRKGEGLTIANALRRTLLTEKSNFYIEWVDFYNAEIPYSILTGMRESIFDILLNLKQILFTSDLILFVGFDPHKHVKTWGRTLNRSKSPHKWIKKKNYYTYYQWSRFENPRVVKKNSIFSALSSITFVKNCAILNNYFNQVSFGENIHNNLDKQSNNFKAPKNRPNQSQIIEEQGSQQHADETRRGYPKRVQGDFVGPFELKDSTR